MNHGLKFLFLFLAHGSISATYAETNQIHIEELVKESTESQISNGEILAIGFKRFFESDYMRLIVPEGDYVVEADEGAKAHLVIDSANDKEVIGENARILFRNLNKTGILIRKSKNIRVSGFAVGWLNDPYIYGRVTDISLVRNRVTIENNIGIKAETLTHLEKVPVRWASIHDLENKRVFLSDRAVIPVKGVKKISKEIIEIELGRSKIQRSDVQKIIGKNFVYIGRYKDVHALKIVKSEKIHIIGNSFFSSPGMGVIARNNSGYINIIRNRFSAENRPISLNADGVHIIDTHGTSRIAKNIFKNLQDDAVVVSKRGALAEYDDEKKLLNILRHLRELNLKESDGIELISFKGSRVNIESSRFKFDRSMKTISLSSSLTSRGIKDNQKLLIFSIKNDSEGDTQIVDNKFEDIRGIGVRINRANVFVSKNRFIGITGPAIRVGMYIGDRWAPQYPGTNVVIESNQFSNSKFEYANRDVFGVVEAICLPVGKACFMYGGDGACVELKNNKFSAGRGYARENYYFDKIFTKGC